MKVFLITGVIRCGHKLYNLEKRIIANTAVDAIQTFREDYPSAKMIRSKALCGLGNKANSKIIFKKGLTKE